MNDMNAVDQSLYQFYRLGGVDEVPPGERIFVEIGDLPIVVFNVGGTFYAIGDVCTHDGGPLGDGELEDHQVICPRHGARFDIRTGEALTLPAVTSTPWYPTRVVDGQIEVGVRR
ncbi:MAG TPA: non-heme iron oxygenase ferredoxin subunit [Anaerolineaceae bacterium]